MAANSVIELIKSKIDIVDEIGIHVQLKKSGKSFKGVCPFHNERTPSFYVFPESGTWRCFGCNEGGDIFTFYEKINTQDFREVLEQLAEKTGIALSHHSNEENGSTNEEDGLKKHLLALHESVAIWFHHLLLTSHEAAYARSYLESRGINSDTITRFRLGFAPETGSSLSSYLLNQGYQEQEIIDAGFARRRDEEKGGGLFDYYRNRLIFPIRNTRGQVIGFGGRDLGTGQPKYLNSPQTLLFDKSSVLYGIDEAREMIRKENRVIIVEGYVDALIAHQFGTKNTVACIGSAITDKHVKQLKKLTKRLSLALDPDTAGEHATLRGIEVAQQAFDHIAIPIPTSGMQLPNRKKKIQGIIKFEEQLDAEITIIKLPANEDPDEFIRRDFSGWQDAIARALPLVDYYFDVFTSQINTQTPQGKAEAVKKLLPIILELGDRIKEDAYLRKLASQLRIDERDLKLEFEELRRTSKRKIGTTDISSESQETANQTQPESTISTLVNNVKKTGGSNGVNPLYKRDSLEEYCLAILFRYPGIFQELHVILEGDDFERTETRALYHEIVSFVEAQGLPLDLPSFINILPPVLQEVAYRLQQSITYEPEFESEAMLSKAGQHAAYRLKLAHLKDLVTEITYLQKEAETSGDRELLRALHQRMQEVLKKKRLIYGTVPLQS